MKRWRKTASINGGTRAAPRTLIHVVSVVFVDAFTANWTFSDLCTSLVSAEGLLIAGQSANDWDFEPPGPDSSVINVRYSLPIAVSDAWSIDGGDVDLSFDSGYPLDTGGTGVVV
jgi:hypothetical protein